MRVHCVIAGPTVGAKMYMDGCWEGSAVLYKHDTYPHSTIGPVSFLWKPIEKTSCRENSTPENQMTDDATEVRCSSCQRRMWLWVHPSCYSAVLEELAVVFNAKEVMQDNESLETVREEEEPMDTDASKDAQENIDNGKEVTEDRNDLKKSEETKETSKSSQNSKEEKPSPKRVLYNPEYTGPRVSFRSLKDTLCRYRLLGPKSLSILQEAFKQPVHHQSRETNSCDRDRLICSKTEKDRNVEVSYGREDKSEKQTGRFGEKIEETAIDVECGREPYWWEESNDHERNCCAWNEFQRHWDPAQVPRNSVLGLTVRDPRLFLPKKITNTQPEARGEFSRIQYGTGFTEGLNAKFQWFTGWYGIECILLVLLSPKSCIRFHITR